MEAYDAAKAANALPEDNPLQDDKPDSPPGCEDQTDPLGAEIDGLAAKLKELQDWLAFGLNYACNDLAS